MCWVVANVLPGNHNLRISQKIDIVEKNNIIEEQVHVKHTDLFCN